MDEEKMTAQTSDDTEAAQEATVEHGEIAETAETDISDERNDATFEENGEGKDAEYAPAEAPNESEKPKQTKEQNAEYARKRREAERLEALEKARVDAFIEALGGKNPYTGDPITDPADVEEYKLMREIEKQGKDPIAEYSRFKKAKEREAAQQRAEEEKRQEWYRNDRAQFEKDYPDVDLSELVKDEQVQSYAEGKVGNKPLSDIYKGYNALIGKTREAAEQKVAQAVANNKATPGALKSAQTGENDFISAEQARKMTPEEVTKNLDKIMKSMKKW